MCMWRCFFVRTNIVLDEELLKEAFELSNAKTKRELVHMALKQYVANCKKKNLLDLKGKVSFSEDYNYKKMREGKSE